MLVAVAKRIAHADCFVVVTPEYNHAYPAALKFLIDSFYKEWQGEACRLRFLRGGFPAGLRAVEQLRLVFAELHASRRSGICVSFANVWRQFDAMPASLH